MLVLESAGKADDIAGGIDVLHRGLIVLVYINSAALVGRETGRAQVKVGGVGLPAGRHENSIYLDRSTGLEGNGQGVIVAVAFEDALAVHEAHPERPQR